MNTFILGIGSNFNAEVNMQKAIALLQNATCFSDIVTSHTLSTSPINLEGNNFLNCVMIAHSPLPFNELKSFTKHIEHLLGRTPEQKKNGIVCIDIDILKCNNTVLKSDYYYDFVQQLLAEII